MAALAVTGKSLNVSVARATLAGSYDPNNVSELRSLYLQISVFSIAVGIFIAAIGPMTKDWETVGRTSS
ncbi:hypothetical protein [Parahaliea mediterranea]|uniref:Uncharacterized protein n=1 Tax=Parahaliea mediterranea TaxID=651086 RepID=A0A939ILN9_9GAMM|nr:hypothetical protein [Parahaliea mediterranea]MBN7798586.1 hypothetical protein [Parahaliea mediterranea]